MLYIEIIAVIISAIKISFVTIYQEWPAHWDDILWLTRLLALNGLPLTLFWYVLRQLIGRGWGLLVIVSVANLLCFANIGKMYILVDPVRYSDIYELSNMIGVKNSIYNIPLISFMQCIDFVFPILLLVRGGATGGLWRRNSPFPDYCDDRSLLNRTITRLSLCVIVVSTYLFIFFQQIPGREPPFPKFFGPWVPEAKKYYRMGALNYFITSGLADLVKFHNRAADAPSKEDVEKAARILMNTRATLVPIQPDGHGDNYPNVIIILLESMAELVFEAPQLKKSGVTLAPFLTSLLQDQLVSSTRIFSPAYGGATSEAELAILASLDSKSNSTGYSYSAYMDHEYMALPRILKTYGYNSAVFHAYRRDFWHRVNAYKALGFDRYDSEEHFSPGTVIGMGLADDDFLSQTLTKMQQLPQPFFAMLITLSGHHPFALPAELRRGLTDNVSGVSEEVKKYLENVNYVDRALEKFWLNSKELRKHSIVVLVGDHNPSLPSREDWRSLGYSMSSVMDPTEDPDFLPLRQVPLIVSAPFMHGQVNKVKGVMGDLTDIAPTLLYLLGIQQPKYFVGSSLFSEFQAAIEYTRPFSIYFDQERHVNMGTGECFSNVGNEKVDKVDCLDLKSEADAIGIISRDVLWGNRFSYLIP